ncbi:MAG: hypothetical protein J5892_02155 [Bacilli bacterium]|nr:hypothetical protein [Bacilli bacterium]
MKIWNNVLKFNCIYQQNGEIKEDYNWHGYVNNDYILDNNHRGVGSAYNIEGVIVDEQTRCYLEWTPGTYIDERYLIGRQGILQPEGIVEFTILPNGTSSPIDYEFRYDEEDNCLYGVYYFVRQGLENDEYAGFAKLTIDQETEYKQIEVDYDIANCEAYRNNDLIIDRLCNYDLPTYQLHNGDEERFIKAKEFFKSNQYKLAISNFKKDNKKKKSNK